MAQAARQTGSDATQRRGRARGEGREAGEAAAIWELARLGRSPWRAGLGTLSTGPGRGWQGRVLRVGKGAPLWLEREGMGGDRLRQDPGMQVSELGGSGGAAGSAGPGPLRPGHLLAGLGSPGSHPVQATLSAQGGWRGRGQSHTTGPARFPGGDGPAAEAVTCRVAGARVGAGGGPRCGQRVGGKEGGPWAGTQASGAQGSPGSSLSETQVGHPRPGPRGTDIGVPQDHRSRPRP